MQEQQINDLARVEGGVRIMQWSLPFIVAVGGITIAVIQLLGR